MKEPLDFRSLAKAINTWATTRPHGFRTSGGPEGFSFIQFHTRPDPRAPEVQITLRAAIVDGQAVIQVPKLTSHDSSERSGPGVDRAVSEVRIEQPIESASSAREPDAVCEGCGAVGTIGRAVRMASTGDVMEAHRFCIACWPEQSARYRARWSEEDRVHSDQFMRGRVPARGAGPGMHFVAATWHASLELVQQVEASMIRLSPPSPQGLARMAAEIQRHASQLEGEMPFAVEAFIARYGAGSL